MANVSFVGTVKSYILPDIESQTTAYQTINENDMSINIDVEILERKQLILEIGKVYLFAGDIHCYNLSLSVREIIDKSLNTISEKPTNLPHNSDYLLTISGKIIEVRCQTTMRGKTVVYAKIEGVDTPKILFFPDQSKRCLSAYENKENIRIIGDYKYKHLSLLLKT